MSNDSPEDECRSDYSEMSILNQHADQISTDIEFESTADLSMDLREITQSILDLEETQVGRNQFDLDCEIPCSPPPSYQHVLEQTKLEEAAALATLTPEEKTPVNNETNIKKGVEIMHKSHKELYRAVAKQWGITCKMSDHCRCLDCQSMYFECEYDENEQEKTDGGLGAGTPMFISEVMHGTACNIL